MELIGVILIFMCDHIFHKKIKMDIYLKTIHSERCDCDPNAIAIGVTVTLQ